MILRKKEHSVAIETLFYSSFGISHLIPYVSGACRLAIKLKECTSYRITLVVLSLIQVKRRISSEISIHFHEIEISLKCMQLLNYTTYFTWIHNFMLKCNHFLSPLFRQHISHIVKPQALSLKNKICIHIRTVFLSYFCSKKIH